MRFLTIATLCLVLASCAEHEQSPDVTQVWSEPPAGIATEATRRVNISVGEALPLADQSEYADARRGFVARIEAGSIQNDDGAVVWDIPQFEFLQGPAPDTVNPSLWRQAQLTAEHGLFEVADGVWQVRGYDLSVMTIIKGDTGWIVTDPLTTIETAAAAMALVTQSLGERPISAVIYTHSHADHFGGARGIVSEEDIEQRGVEIFAPIGFSDHAVSENVVAGNHMARRAAMMFGDTIARSADGHVSSGLGPALPRGTVSLVLPTEEIAGRGTKRVIDGVEVEFIDAAGTEAPAGLMFYLPEKGALCAGDVILPAMHNLLTLRGAKVRDALEWSRVIDYVLAEYGDKIDVILASHNWPTWGRDNVQQFLKNQRDIYRYIHDQTLRQANAGATMTEAAEAIDEPAFMRDGFKTRSYYGTLNHNSKAVFQFYYGWWGGVPAEYNRLPHETTAPRYVQAMGGAEAVLATGISAFEKGDYRWAAEIFNHLVFAEPGNKSALGWLAAAYEQLGFQAESGAWRSYYLAGASELRNGVPEGLNAQTRSADLLRAIPTLALFDAMAVRFNPRKMTRDPFVVNFVFGDTDEAVAVHVGADLVVPRMGREEGASATITMDRSVFNRVLLQEVDMRMQVVQGKIRIEGDRGAPTAFFQSLDEVELGFPVVTP